MSLLSRSRKIKQESDVDEMAIDASPFTLVPPQPPVSSAAKTVRFADAPASTTTAIFEPTGKRKPLISAANGKKKSAISKRPLDLFINDAAVATTTATAAGIDVDEDGNEGEEVATAEEGVVALRSAGDAEQSESMSGGNVMSMDSYSLTSRYLVDSIMRSAAFDESGSEKAHQNVGRAFIHAENRRGGIAAAAYTNHTIRVIKSSFARSTTAGGIKLLQETPYSDPTSSAFAANFIAAAIECSPEANAHEHVPSEELRAASRPVAYEYITSFMRTHHPNEAPCAAREECVGNKLYGPKNERVPQTVWKVFWFADELAEMEKNPRKFATEAKYRYCIGCKIYQALKCVVNVTSRNNRVLPDVLAADFHVFVDVPGEFPITATRGRCNNGHHGLVSNVPVFPFVGWTVEPDGQRSGCFIYKWNVPRYPLNFAKLLPRPDQGF